FDAHPYFKSPIVAGQPDDVVSLAPHVLSFLEKLRFLSCWIDQISPVSIRRTPTRRKAFSRAGKLGMQHFFSEILPLLSRPLIGQASKHPFAKIGVFVGPERPALAIHENQPNAEFFSKLPF